MIRMFLAVFLCSACVNQNRENSTADTLTTAKNNEDYLSQQVNSDTTILYDIYGISTEGAEAKATYHNKTIVHATTNVYGEMGKVEYTFIFDGDSVKVKQWVHRYTAPITSPDSKEVTLPDSTTCTLLAKNGRLVRGKSNQMLDATLETFLKEVPLQLR